MAETPKDIKGAVIINLRVSWGSSVESMQYH